MTRSSESAKNNIQKIVAGAVGFFILIFLYANEFSWYGNTFDRNQLILVGLLLGLIVGIGIAYKLQRENQEIIERFQLYIGIMVVSAVLMPLVFSMTNRILSFRGVTEESVEFVETEAFNESRFGLIPQEKPDGYYAILVRKGKVVRITSKEPMYENAVKGQRVILPVKKGLWGFEIAYPHLLLHE